MDGNFKDQYLTMSGIDQTTENTEKITQLDKGISDFLYSTVPNFVLAVAVPQTIKGVKTFVENIVGTGMTASAGFLSMLCDKYTGITIDTRMGINIYGTIQVPDNSFSISATRGLDDKLKSLAITKTTGIADKSIINQNLADECITSDKIKAGTIISPNIGLMTIQGINILSNTIDNRVLADGCIEPRNMKGIYNIAIPFSPTNYAMNIAADVSFYGSDAAPFMTKFSYPTAYTINAITVLFDDSKYANEAELELLMESVRGIQTMSIIKIPNNYDKLTYSIVLPTLISFSQNTTLQILHTFLKPQSSSNVKKVRYILHGATV